MANESSKLYLHTSVSLNIYTICTSADTWQVFAYQKEIRLKKSQQQQTFGQ